MAQKQKQRPSPLDDPPTASSSDSEEEEEEHVPSSQHEEEEEEEEASSQEGDEASSEEDEPSSVPQPVSKNTPQSLPTNSHTKVSSSESDSETDSDSDSHPPVPAAANPKVKPLASKPMEQVQKPKVQPSPKSGSKRAVENNANVSDPKRAKKKSTDSSSVVVAAAAAAASDDEIEEDEKKSGEHSKKFQRLWSEEDEINILKGVAEFTHRTGQDPMKYANPFHEFMKKSLHVDASSNQLKEKVRRLKKKFEINAGKGKNGEGPKFSKPHDQKAFELSNKAWGSEPSGGGGGANGAVEKPKSNGKVTKSPKKEAGSRITGSAKKPETKPEAEPASLDLKESGKMDIDQKADGNASLLFSEMTRYRNGEGVYGLNEDDLKRGLELMEESKRAELEGKWKNLRLVEMELFSKRALLVGEQTRLILEALESSRN